MERYKIADQVLEINYEPQYEYEDMGCFHTDDTRTADLSIDFCSAQKIDHPDTAPLISSFYIRIFSENNTYISTYMIPPDLIKSVYDLRSNRAIIYLTQDAEKKCEAYNSSLTSARETRISVKEAIFYAIRDLFLIHIQQKGILAVHSSSIIYDDKAYLFSASSGTGKTTHTNFWVEHFGAQILDGDVTAVCMENGEAIAYGLPWCGTSKKFQNRRVPLGGIIFVTRSCHNTISRLSPFESIIRLSARCFTPTWTPELADRNIEIATQLVPNILTAVLGCLPELNAAEVAKAYIDKNK